MIFSRRGEFVFKRRVRSSTWPSVDSTAGRIESLMSFRLVVVSWSEPSICCSRGPIESTVWRTWAIVWLRWLRSTGPKPTCSMIGSKNEVSTPGIDCPATSATVDRPVERMLTWLMPVRAGWIETFTSWRSFLTRSAGSETRTRARSIPSTSTRSTSTTLPVSRPATRTGLPMRMP